MLRGKEKCRAKEKVGLEMLMRWHNEQRMVREGLIEKLIFYKVRE